jgi:hypothetical protein
MDEVYWRSPQVIAAELDGKPLLLNLADWTHVSLNETGGRIWELLAEPSDAAALLARLREEFDAPEDVLRRDLDDFLRRLGAQGLIVTA